MFGRCWIFDWEQKQKKNWKMIRIGGEDWLIRGCWIWLSKIDEYVAFENIIVKIDKIWQDQEMVKQFEMKFTKKYNKVQTQQNNESNPPTT